MPTARHGIDTGGTRRARAPLARTLRPPTFSQATSSDGPQRSLSVLGGTGDIRLDSSKSAVVRGLRLRVFNAAAARRLFLLVSRRLPEHDAASSTATWASSPPTSSASSCFFCPSRCSDIHLHRRRGDFIVASVDEAGAPRRHHRDADGEPLLGAQLVQIVAGELPRNESTFAGTSRTSTRWVTSRRWW